MRTVTADASDTELIACLSEWSDLMAAGDYAAAVAFLHPPAEGSNAETWTATSLKTYIENYGSWDRLADGSLMRVTSIASAEHRRRAPHEVFRYQHQLPDIEFRLPLDGEWSDLTAMINMVEVNGRWAFVLYDLQVL
jgi:hypothetical protein